VKILKPTPNHTCTILRSIIRANGVPSPNGVWESACPSTSSSAPGPLAATECVGWRLRATPGEERKRSVSEPIVDGVFRTSKTGSVERYSAAPPTSGKAGIAIRPVGPSTSSNAATTVAEPPSIWPNRLSDEWRKTPSPSRRPTSRRHLTMSSRVTVTGAARSRSR
jgi:hypothetical protein